SRVKRRSNWPSLGSAASGAPASRRMCCKRVPAWSLPMAFSGKDRALFLLCLAQGRLIGLFARNFPLEDEAPAEPAPRGRTQARSASDGKQDAFLSLTRRACVVPLGLCGLGRSLALQGTVAPAGIHPRLVAVPSPEF